MSQIYGQVNICSIQIVLMFGLNINYNIIGVINVRFLLLISNHNLFLNFIKLEWNFDKWYFCTLCAICKCTILGDIWDTALIIRIIYSQGLAEIDFCFSTVPCLFDLWGCWRFLFKLPCHCNRCCSSFNR